MRMLGRTVVVACLVLAGAGRAWAQDAASPSAPAAAPQAETGAPKPRVADRKFWLMSGALVTSMLMDTRSTFDVSSRCPDCIEANPFVAPFVDRGPTTTYVAGLAFDAGVMTV